MKKTKKVLKTDKSIENLIKTSKIKAWKQKSRDIFD